MENEGNGQDEEPKINEEERPKAPSLEKQSTFEGPDATSPQGKKVTHSEDPEVFTIVPDTTATQQVERPPKPPPPPPEITMPQQDLDKIISDTMAILENGQKVSNQQKLANQKMMFMLTRIIEALDYYEQHVERLKTFLYHNNLIQAEWYYKCYQQLPSYGDYVQTLKDSPEKIQVDDIPFPVCEADLKKLSEDVFNNFYAGGAHVRTQRNLCKRINETMETRTQLLADFYGPVASWFSLMNSAAINQDVIKSNLFKVSAQVGFLKTGENKEPLKLDISRIHS